MNISHMPLIAFHTPTPCPSLTTLEHQPPSTCPYLPTITHFQRGSLSLANLQDHLPKRASLRMVKSLIPKPPCCLSNRTIAHLTKCGFCSKAPPPHKKSLWIFSSLAATLLGMTKRDKVNQQTGQSALQQSQPSTFWKILSSPQH